MDRNQTDCAVEVQDLSRRFGKTVALDALSLQVPTGAVLGLLGPNGAGKTTLLRLLMGHLRPDSGEISILGRSLTNDLIEIRNRVGYVSDNRYVYDWMTVDETLWFTSAFHDTWDEGKAMSLMDLFQLPGDKKIRELSQGNRARLCLTLALSYNPELIILDEPTSGLDPIIRRDFLDQIIAELCEEGKTVIFSSHIVDEVERVADHIAIVDQGQLLLHGEMDHIKSSICRVRYPINGHIPDLSGIPNILRVKTFPDEHIVTIKDFDQWTASELEAHGVINPQVSPMTLEDIFVEIVQTHEQEAA